MKSRNQKIVRRKIDPSSSSSPNHSEASSINGEESIVSSLHESIGNEEYVDFDNEEYDFEQLLDESIPIDEFDQLSDRLLTGFELKAKVAALRSSSSCFSSSSSHHSAVSTPSHCLVETSSGLNSGNTSSVEEDGEYSPRKIKEEGSSSTDLITLTGDANGKPKKRKRKSYYVKRFPFPRILKRDVRRDYAIMLTNVLNSADESLMLKFFRRFCMSSCQYVDCFPDEYINNKPFIRYAKGVDAIVYRLLQDFSSIPDFVIRLLNANIVQKNGMNGSQIVCNVEFSGTKMFHYMRPDLITSIEEMRLQEEEAASGRGAIAAEESKEGDEQRTNTTSKDKAATVTTANYLKKMMKKLANNPDDHHHNSFAAPLTLSDTENNLRTNRMKILSLYSNEYQQLLNNNPSPGTTTSASSSAPSTAAATALSGLSNEDLTEMKLSSETTDQLLSKFFSNSNDQYSANIQDLMNLYSTYVVGQKDGNMMNNIMKNIDNEEKMDSSSLIHYMNKFLTSNQQPSSSSSSTIAPSSRGEGQGEGILSLGSSANSLSALPDSANNPVINPQLLSKNDKPLLSKPISIKFAGQITLSLNEEHCLYQFEVKSSIYDTKVLLSPPPIAPSPSTIVK